VGGAGPSPTGERSWRGGVGLDRDATSAAAIKKKNYGKGWVGGSVAHKRNRSGKLF